MNRFRRALKTPVIVSLILLCLQNLAIFWHHYIGQANFLNDFTRIYYPMTAFWIELVKHGEFPEWLPYQNMGFPFILTMQSGVFYLPFWVFTISDHLDYTPQAANIVQSLHVLFGAVGCWYYLRRLGLLWTSALFGAIAFQFFGGFYSNAEHADIIRAYAWLPWLFLVCHIQDGETTLSQRHLFIPLVVMLFVCGAYQGNIFSQFFCLAVFGVLRCISMCRAIPSQRSQLIALHGRLVLLGLVGFGLASVYLIPTFALKDYLVRSDAWSGRIMDWDLIYWNSLFMPLQAGGVYMFTSMISAFITLPVFCLLFLVDRRVIVARYSWALLTLLALVMAIGDDTPVYRWLIQVFPFLGYSRFPSSDYRGVFCFGLVTLAATSLDVWSANRSTRVQGRMASCLAVIGVFTLLSCVTAWLQKPTAAGTVMWLQDHNLKDPIASLLGAGMNMVTKAPLFDWLLVWTGAFLIFICLRFMHRYYRAAFIGLIVIEMASGAYNLAETTGDWHVMEPAERFFYTIHFDKSLPVLDTVLTQQLTRPPCKDMDVFDESWRGYLEGIFLCRSHDSQTRPRTQVHNNEVLRQVMRMPAQTWLVEKEQLRHCAPEDVFQSGRRASTVQPASYGLEQVSYHVHAAGDFCFVENKMMFAGWRGYIRDKPATILPQAYCEALRSWCLPAGDYEFTEHYRSPGLRMGAVLSLLFLAIYVVIAWCWSRRRNT